MAGDNFWAVPGFRDTNSIETCLACHIEHHNLVCNVYLSHGDKLHFNSNRFLFINYKCTFNYIAK